MHALINILYYWFNFDHFNCDMFLFLLCMGTSACFSVIFTKGNNFCHFLLAFQEDIAL